MNRGDQNDDDDTINQAFINADDDRGQTHERKDVIDMEMISGRTQKHGSISSVDSVDSEENGVGSGCLDRNAVRKRYFLFMRPWSNGY